MEEHPSQRQSVFKAEIIFGRKLRDGFAFLNKLDKFFDLDLGSVWIEG